MTLRIEHHAALRRRADGEKKKNKRQCYEIQIRATLFHDYTLSGR
jgi:hypothetical protein